MLLPAKFARYPGKNWQRNVEIGFNVIYAMNISAQSAMTREIFLQMIIIFLVFFYIWILRSDFCLTAYLGA